MKYNCLPCVFLLTLACAFMMSGSAEARHHHHHHHHHKHHRHHSNFALNLNTYATPAVAYAPAYYYPQPYVVYPEVATYYAPAVTAYPSLSFGFSFR